jgi:alpha-1,3-rhamnosyl/mannosyltransferase
LPEVSGGAALEVDPLDVGALAEAMLALVRDETLRTRCIDAGRARAAAMTWRATAHATAKVYHALLTR